MRNIVVTFCARIFHIFHSFSLHFFSLSRNALRRYCHCTCPLKEKSEFEFRWKTVFNIFRILLLIFANVLLLVYAPFSHRFSHCIASWHVRTWLLKEMRRFPEIFVFMITCLLSISLVFVLNKCNYHLIIINLMFSFQELSLLRQQKERWPVQRLCEIVIASNVGRSEKNFLFCSQESVAAAYSIQDMDLILSLNWKWMPRQRTENVLHLRTRNDISNKWRGSEDGSGSGIGADNNNNVPIRRINEDERNGK